MSHDYVEAVMVLLPAEVGGRATAVEPREGAYRPYARTAAGSTIRMRIIEGPPRVAPGQDARVVAEVETPLLDDALLVAGSELHLIEQERVVGLLTVARLWRGAVVM
jgi:hypothetical protein